MGVNLAAIRRRYEAMKRGDTNRYKPSTGDNIIRIVEFRHGKFDFVYVAGRQHYGVCRYSKMPVECPTGLYGGDCAICDTLELIESDPAEATAEDLALIKQWQTKDVIYFNVVDVQKPELGCQVWPCSSGLAQDILGLISAVDTDGNLLYPDLASHSRGINLILNMTGSGKNTRYEIEPATRREGDVIRISRTALPEDCKPIDLMAFVKAPSYEFTESIITAPDRDHTVERKSRSRLDVLGEPEYGKVGWTEYLWSEEDAGEQEVAPGGEEAPPPSKPAGRSALDKLRNKKAAAADDDSAMDKVRQSAIPPTTTGDPREPMTDPEADIPWCCGFLDEETGETNEGQWVGSGDPACEQCLAAEICKEYTTIETGLEDVGDAEPEPEPPAKESTLDRLRKSKAKTAAGDGTQQALPGMEKQSGGKAAAKKEAVKETTGSAALDRLKNKRAAKNKK